MSQINLAKLFVEFKCATSNGNGNGVTVTKQVDVKKKRGMMLKLAAWFCSFQKPKSR